jgi:putative transposase
MVGWPGAAQDRLPAHGLDFGLAVLMLRGNQAKNAELPVLRHEKAVLRRNAGRVRYEPADRAWFTALTRFIPRRPWTGVFPVTPATLLAWHRRLAARRYDTSNRRPPGRPPTVCSIARLAVRLAEEAPLWGYRRIHGELTKLGVTVAPSTVYEILRSSGIGPAPRRDGPTWRQFLHAQAAGILAVDSSRRYRAAKQAVRAEIHRARHSPDAPGRRHRPPDRSLDGATGPQPGNEPRRAVEDFRFLIRDRGSNFTRSFDAVFQATGTTILHTGVQAPRMNAICERLAGTLRRELLDRSLILGEAHLRAVLAEYQKHYNTARPHQGIGQRIPDSAHHPPRVIAADFRIRQICQNLS